jgi:asparagine synthetase B (glutamine-hydrolysing)
MSHNNVCRNCYSANQTPNHCNHPSLGVLFSGGIDSTLLALLAHNHVPRDQPIDLLNVAFDENAPDRVTGLVALEELKTLAPDREWNFVAIDVKKPELDEARSELIRNLVHPLDTVLDDSIGCSLWFAARGRGSLHDQEDYSSPCRVLLLGMGADEQFVGYSRHRRVFDTSGFEGLLDEIRLELDRLPSRNLGRDDRILSDQSREPRFPFLDEDVVCSLNGLQVWRKCDLRQVRGKGEKMLLRKIGQKLGLVLSSRHEKRAIQFGSRIAKIDGKSKGEKGHQKCNRLFKS